jgi:MGT family glycosyltransferase
MAHLLFAAHPTVGHTSALRAIAARLLAQGHAIDFAIVPAHVPAADRWPAPVQAASALPRRLRADGFTVLPLPRSWRALWHAIRLPGRVGLAELAEAIALFTSDMPAQARAIASYATARNAAVIVGDYLMPAALLAARLSDRPYVALYHSALPFPVADAPPFGSQLASTAAGTPAWQAAAARLAALSQQFADRTAAAAHALGITLPRPITLTRPVSDTLNLLATLPVLEPGLLLPDAPAVMIGPCLPLPSAMDQGHPALHALPDAGLRVYVSLGTVFNEQPAVYRRILDGLAALDAAVIVGAGRSAPMLRTRHWPRVLVYESVPQVALLRQVDIVVTHGGNNTVQECLAAGRPMVVLPFGGDQHANAARVTRLGAGVALDAASFTPAQLGAAVQTAWRQCAATAARLGAVVAQADGAAHGADAILALIADGA